MNKSIYDNNKLLFNIKYNIEKQPFDNVLFDEYNANAYIVINKIYTNPQIKELNIPNEIDGIPVGMLNERSCAELNIEKVFIPHNVWVVGKATFIRCKNLKEVIVNEDNPFISSENGMVFNKDKTELLLIPQGIEGDISIPDTVKEIDYDVFKNHNINIVLKDDVNIKNVRFDQDFKQANISYEGISYKGEEKSKIFNILKNIKSYEDIYKDIMLK